MPIAGEIARKVKERGNPSENFERAVRQIAEMLEGDRKKLLGSLTRLFDKDNITDSLVAELQKVSFTLNSRDLLEPINQEIERLSLWGIACEVGPVELEIAPDSTPLIRLSYDRRAVIDLIKNVIILQNIGSESELETEGSLRTIEPARSCSDEHEAHRSVYDAELKVGSNGGIPLSHWIEGQTPHLDPDDLDNIDFIAHHAEIALREFLSEGLYESLIRAIIPASIKSAKDEGVSAKEISIGMLKVVERLESHLKRQRKVADRSKQKATNAQKRLAVVLRGRKLKPLWKHLHERFRDHGDLARLRNEEKTQELMGKLGVQDLSPKLLKQNLRDPQTVRTIERWPLVSALAHAAFELDEKPMPAKSTLLDWHRRTPQRTRRKSRR